MRLIALCCLVTFSGLTSAATSPNTCTELTASANTEYPPYSWRSHKNPSEIAGAMPLLVKRIGQEIGVNIRVLYVGAWARTQSELANGHIDLIAGAFFTQPRTKVMDYLYPSLTITQSVVWENTENTFEFTELADLKKRQGATIINNSLGQTFDEYAKEHLTLFQVASIEQAFRMLSDRRIDYVAYEKEPSQYSIQQLKLTNIAAQPVAITHEPLHLTLSKKSPCNTPDLRQLLTKALEKAQQEGWAEQYLAQVKTNQFSD